MGLAQAWLGKSTHGIRLYRFEPGIEAGAARNRVVESTAAGAVALAEQVGAHTSKFQARVFQGDPVREEDRNAGAFLLEACRFRASREFFDIDVERASQLVERAVELTEFLGPVATHIGRSKELPTSRYRPTFTIAEHHLMDLVLASTHDMMFRHGVRDRRSDS